MWTFWSLEPIFKNVTQACLNSLQQKRCINWKMICHDSTKKNGFQNIKINLNSTTWMTLECSVVIFQALEYPWPQWPQQLQQPQWPQWPQQPHFTKEITPRCQINEYLIIIFIFSPSYSHFFHPAQFANFPPYTFIRHCFSKIALI